VTILSPLGSPWRREQLRTNLWLVPMLEVAAAVGLYAGTHAIDVAAHNGSLTLPPFVIVVTAEAGRQILTALAAAVITVVGVVFSIMIVTLTLASTQFGPRMLRNFIRDRGTQLTLGTFVATFVYAMLVLISIAPGLGGHQFVPELSITVAVGLVTVSLAVLIYFIHHIATTIQLPQVIASIARDLSRAIDVESREVSGAPESGPTVAELLARIESEGGTVPAPASGYLQYVRLESLVRIAASAGAVIRLHQRPGHFVVGGQEMATVWPAQTTESVSRALRKAHLTGPYRTLTQDLAFAVDQLVEIGIRALSPAVNDTFTALTAVDWLGEGMCKATSSWHPVRIHRDREGQVRVITAHVSYERLVARAFEKIRQAARGMPAVLMRQLEALARIMLETRDDEQRRLLLAQAALIYEASEESVPQEADRADVRGRHAAVLAAAERMAAQAR
jgi:uncharacterized membrane protein